MQETTREKVNMLLNGMVFRGQVGAKYVFTVRDRNFLFLNPAIRFAHELVQADEMRVVRLEVTKNKGNVTVLAGEQEVKQVGGFFYHEGVDFIQESTKVMSCIEEGYRDFVIGRGYKELTATSKNKE